MKKAYIKRYGSRALMRCVISVVVVCTIGMMNVRAQELDYEATVQEVLSEIQKGIYQAQQELDRNRDLPKLNHVELTLNTVIKELRETGFNLLIFSYGKQWEKEYIHKLTLRLQPIATLGFAGKPMPPLSKQLADAIIGAARGVVKARDPKLPMKMQRLSVELCFIVRTDRSGGAGLRFSIEIINLDLKGKVNIKNEVVQKLAVVFE